MLGFMYTSPHIETETVAYRPPIIYSASRGVFELVGHYARVRLFFEKSWGAESRTSEPNLVLDAMSYVLGIQKDLSIHAGSHVVGKFDLPKWLFRHEKVSKKYVN